MTDDPTQKEYPLALVKKVSLWEAAEFLREALAEHQKKNPPKDPPYKIGDIVEVELSNIGIVQAIDYESSVAVLWIDSETGELRGPSYGWNLRKIDLGD